MQDEDAASPEMSPVASTSAADYPIEPEFSKRFRPAKARTIMSQVLRSKLTGVQYHADNTSGWTTEIADEIKTKLKGLGLERYKFVVQVVIGEQRGEGVRMGCRCFWDTNTDNYAEETFLSETIFCVATAFGVYLY
ncbi:hypothetical protein KFL_003650090 [Klebsormidium nitens]|uniref:Tctex1 domain-containing protein 2 n=1 Tax=Klebsormidium nitens TaxID=105231 RepID=A0A1Y1IHK2_KLENI|nr:hypothetical protein KFL_003650090 [Klebsormidium nitens]|eukprot:GAQ87618.1 hypothetical protein KFL_003650090 [Klebsormidium nitens]